MSKISLAPDASGTGIFSIVSPNSNTNRTLTLPDDTGTIVTNSGNQAGSFTTLNTSGAVVFNDAGADVDFRVEGDTNANLLFVDASADAVGIGTNSPDAKLDVTSTGSASSYTVSAVIQDATYPASGNPTLEFNGFIGGNGYRSGVGSLGGQSLAFYTPSTYGVAPTERMRIDSSGNVLIGTSSSVNNRINVAWDNATNGGMRFSHTSTSYNQSSIEFYNVSETRVGFIYSNASSTQYSTSSDYRLKENVAPMTGALAKVLELNPVTYTWKADGSAGEGFIAHELQAVCPQAVTGQKDETEIQQVEVSPAVPATYDDEGNELTPAVEAVYEEREIPKYQGVDTSFLVATLTAAIQELSAKNDALEARIAALETGA